MNLFGEPTAESRRRASDPLWDALLAVCGIETENVTRSARGAYNRSLADLKLMHATVEDIEGHALVFKVRWPEVSLTPTALVRRWAETMPKKKVVAMAAKIVRAACPKCTDGWIEQDDGSVVRCSH